MKIKWNVNKSPGEFALLRGQNAPWRLFSLNLLCNPKVNFNFIFAIFPSPLTLKRNSKHEDLSQNMRRWGKNINGKREGASKNSPQKNVSIYFIRHPKTRLVTKISAYLLGLWCPLYTSKSIQDVKSKDLVNNCQKFRIEGTPDFFLRPWQNLCEDVRRSRLCKLCCSMTS